MHNKAERRFISLSFAGIISLLLLILAGGIVRSSGSGMGCPDWPKCFNRWVPPTDISELPTGYKDVYVAKRIKKNQRAAGFFSWLGYKDLAYAIQHDNSVLRAENFNVAKTYTEYINRLIGVITGFIFVAAWVCSFTYLKTLQSIFWTWSIALLLIGFQGWLGSIVVSSNLDTGLITVHMLLALLILTLAVFGFTKASRAGKSFTTTGSGKSLYLNSILTLAALVLVLQIIFGTRVRELLDLVAAQHAQSDRGLWVKDVGADFNWHRDFSILVVIGVILVSLALNKLFKGETEMIRVGNINLILTGVQIVLGITLAYMGLPPFSQALHIFVATLIFGNMMYILFLANGQVKRIAFAADSLKS